MENQYDKAYDLSKYMAEQYPDNPFFERYYARAAFVRGRLSEAETISKDILAKIEAGKMGYEGVSGRTAAYVLAYINQNFYRNMPLARQYYEKSIEFAKKTNSLDTGYYWSSVLALGKSRPSTRSTIKRRNTSRKYSISRTGNQASILKPKNYSGK